VIFYGYGHDRPAERVWGKNHRAVATYIALLSLASAILCWRQTTPIPEGTSLEAWAAIEPAHRGFADLGHGAGTPMFMRVPALFPPFRSGFGPAPSSVSILARSPGAWASSLTIKLDSPRGNDLKELTAGVILKSRAVLLLAEQGPGLHGWLPATIAVSNPLVGVHRATIAIQLQNPPEAGHGDLIGSGVVEEVVMVSVLVGEE
jgi:hypothetical protein